jgi:hypothetical protein
MRGLRFFLCQPLTSSHKIDCLRRGEEIEAAHFYHDKSRTRRYLKGIDSKRIFWYVLGTMKNFKYEK